MNHLNLPHVQKLLARLHNMGDAADRIVQPRTEALRRAGPEHMDPTEMAACNAAAWWPVSPETGKVLYMLTRIKRPRRIVEFGTSHGLAAIYMAAALEDNGDGELISCEYVPEKSADAQKNLTEAGLDHRTDIRTGDAMARLPGSGPVDMLFLDGDKLLYLPLLQKLKPELAPGALVIADDTDVLAEVLQPFLAAVRAFSGWMTIPLPVDDGLSLCLCPMVG